MLSKNHFVATLLVFIMSLTISSVSASQCSIDTYLGTAFTMPKIEQNLLNPDTIKTELENWITQIKATHPKLDMATDYDQLLSIKNKIISQVNRPMSQLEVFRLFSLLNPVFKDGHHGIVLSGRNKKITAAITLGDRLFPFEVYIDDDYRLYVKKQYSELVAGTEIFAINGVKVTEINRYLEQHARGDTPRFRRQLVSDRFSELLWQHFGSSPKYQLTIKHQKDCAQLVFDGQTDIFIHRQNDPGFDHHFDLRFMADNSVAYLKVGTFYLPQGMEQWELFIQKAFKEIERNKSQHLIIDIRENGGGDDRLWVEGIMPYIADKDWQRMANFIGRVRDSDDDFPGRIGEVAVFDFQGKHPVSELLSFKGKVYVITGRRTYSSAIMFASAVQDNKLGQIVGQDTEARGCSTGMPNYHDMPITELVAFTPIHWYQRNNTQSCLQGIKADINLPDDPFDGERLVALLVEQITTKS